jgi:hemerythrin-like metal-binding protein
MALFEWKPLYSVGDSRIDAQHQQLFSIANRLHEAHSLGRGKQVLGGIFQELIDYTVTHFAEEEALLQRTGYPDYLRHKQNHEKLLGLVSGYQRQFERGEDGTEERLMAFIKTWLDGHILGMDRNYSQHVLGATSVA